MTFAQSHVKISHDSINSSNNIHHESSYRECMLLSVWTLSRLVASLLDQIGLAYHRVFDNKALELFLVLSHTEFSDCKSAAEHSVDIYSPNALSTLNHDLQTIQSKLISSMDFFVVETLENTKKQTKQTKLLHRLLGKHRDWELCAKSRFEQVICPILEQNLIKQNS